MAIARWRRAIESTTDHALHVRYRIETFGQARSVWRSTAAEAIADAIALDLASWDSERREHYLAVPVELRVAYPS